MGFLDKAKETFRDKHADRLCAHLLGLGIQAEQLHEHPLQKVRTDKSWWLSTDKVFLQTTTFWAERTLNITQNKAMLFPLDKTTQV